MFKRFLKGLLIVVLVAGLGFASGYYSDAALKKIIPAEKMSKFNKYLEDLKSGKNSGQPETRQENSAPGTTGEPEGIAPAAVAGSEKADQVQELQETDLALGGLKIGDKRQTVEKVMGRPVKIHKSYDRETGQSIRTFENDRLNTEWGKKTGVFSITITSPGITTVRGLQVGDAMEKAYRLYGRPVAELGGLAAYKYPGSGTEVFFIKFGNNKVMEIKISMKKVKKV